MARRIGSEAIAAIILLACSLGTASLAADPTATGLWEKVDGDNKPEGWFRIGEKGGVYEGQLVKAFPKPGEDPSTWRCTKCEDERKDAPVVGITLIKGMQRQGLVYENGTILDPRDGSVYKARMELSPDGKQLSVRGFLGISLFGRTDVWKRLPDNAVDEPKATGRPGSPPAASKGQSKGGTAPAAPR
jgi:uncharacterized protein (DUF2147 family)